MEKALAWWNDLPKWKQKKLAFDEQWTTPEDITDRQIQLIYEAKVDCH